MFRPLKTDFQPVPICALLLVCMIVAAPRVLAQTTNVSHVTYPSTAVYDIDTETSTPPLLVKATVSYEGAKPGFTLVAGVFDLDSGNLASGVASASPSSCETTSEYAGCDIPLSSSQGSDIVEFLLGRPENTWNLALISGLLNNTGSTIDDSISDYTFSITVHTGLTLQVEAPIPVQITVDGTNGTGIVSLKLPAGSHALSVPEIVPFSNDTRLKFSDWSDGSSAANRTVSLDHDLSLQANYVTQYRLTVFSPDVNVAGSGWYDNGSVAKLTVPATNLPMSGPLGALGARWVFVGWSEDEGALSQPDTQTVDMNSPHTITAEWRADYNLPIVLFALLMLAIGFVVILQIPKMNRHGRSRPRIRTRRRIGTTR